MYKGTSQSLQRSHGVRLIAPQKGYIADDYLPDAETAPLPELVDERQRLLHELARCENEISAAKRAGHKRLSGGIGHRKASICERLGVINDRIKLLRQINRSELWRQAIAEICPDHAALIEARYRELEGSADA